MVKIFVLLMMLISFVPAKEMTHVTLQLEWKDQFQFAGFYAAQKMGYYKQKGIDLELLEYQKGMDIPARVTAGKADFGISSSQLALERIRGRPIVLLASYFKQNALALAVQPEITSVSQLRGKTIMAVQRALQDSNLALMLQNEGLSRSDYSVMPHQYVIDPFVNRQVDAMTVLVSSQPYELKAAGKDFNLFNPADFGLYSYDMELFTSQAYAMKNPALVRDFIEATKRGWEYAFAHRSEMIDYIYNNLSQRKSKDALEFEARKVEKLFKRDVYTIGSVAPELIMLNARLYEKLGLVSDENDISDLLDSYAFDYDRYKNMLPLTGEEKNFLQRLDTVRVDFHSDRAPFGSFTGGKPGGYVYDILRYAGKYLGIAFEYTPLPSGADPKTRLQNGRADMTATLNPQSPDRDSLLFSKPVYQNKLAVAHTMHEISSLQQLQGKRVGITKDSAFYPLLKQKYPKLHLHPLASHREGLQLLKQQRLDAFVSAQTVLKHLIAKENMYHLQLDGLSYDPGFIQTQSFAFDQDSVLLHSVINKALDALKPATLQTLRKKWQSIDLPAAKSSIDLSAKEKNYLRRHPTLRVHNETDWAPYNYAKEGQPMGLSVDYMKLLAAKAGFNVEFVTGPTWNEFMDMLKRGRIDVMLNIAQTRNREEDFLFTKPYMQTQTVVYTAKDVGYEINSISQLEGKKVAVIKGFVQQDIFERSYPDLEMVETDSVLQSLQAVREGRAFAVVGSYGIYNHTIKQHSINDIKAHPFLSHDELNTELAMATGKNKPILRDILEKARQNVSYEEFETIKNRWLNYDQHKTRLFNERVLSTKQLQYLRSKGRINVCIDPKWMPFESFKEGKHIGMSADIFKHFQKYLNVDLNVVNTQSWTQSLEYAKQRKCDILSLAMSTPDRQEYMNFTKPYMSIPLVLATRKNVTFVDDFDKLVGKKVAIVKDYAFAELLERKYPRLNLHEVGTTKAGLDGVAKGEYFGFIGTLASVGYHFQYDFTGELKIAGKFDEKWELAVAVRDDDAVLLSIFDTLVGTLDDEIKQQVFNKWVAITYEKGKDYTLVWQVALAAMVLLGVIIYWNRRLYLLNKELFNAKEKAQEATRAKSTFLANMSHEIRTPLNAITGLIYLLKQTPLNDKQLDQVGKIETSANNLLNIINDILDFSKIEAGKVRIENIHFNLEEMMHNVQSMIGFKARQKGLEFTLAIDDDVPRQLYGDPYRITQVLINLVGNAVKFTDTGSVEIRVWQNEGMFYFSISDSGIGLNKKQQKHLFDSFTQADPSTTRNYGGTGLGLAISKQLVELMGGSIWFESRYKKGSTFYFTLPLRTRQSDGAAPGQEVKKNNDPSRLQSGTVLLAEDNVTNQEILVSLLENSPVLVDIASDGQQAVQMYTADANRYDLVLMDIQMPVMDGYEAGRKILESDPDARIVALSANAMKEDISRSRQSGFVDHLNKPLDIDRFYELLGHYFTLDTPKQPQLPQEGGEQECIDTDQAVRTLGQWSVFVKVAASFYNQYSRMRLKELPLEQRAKEVHSLKGIGANVGAGRLQELAAAYESRPDPQALSRLQAELDCVLAALANVLQTQNAGTKKEDDERLEQLWQQLRQALETKRPHRIEPVVKELQTLQMDAKRQEIFDTMQQYITAYKFKEALELLQ